MDQRLQSLLSKLQSMTPRREDVDVAMARQLQRIRIRSLSGLGVDGFPFARKKDGSPSTLFKTGNLLRSLQTLAGHGDVGIVGRIIATGKARGYAPYVNAKRRFMGASTGDRMDMLSEIRNSIRSRR